MRPHLALDDIADGILDGAPIDWSHLHANEALGDVALLEQLKTLDTLRRRGRAQAAHDPSGAWRWGHLQVFERIGHGAYGDVHRAWDTRLDREVALKLLPADEPSAMPTASTVIEEGRLLARVRHPNVVTIYGAERIDGRVGLWMEFVKGRTLEEAIRSGRRFTVAEVTRLGAELCGAVAAVHAAGLLHQDIKAQNVMIDDSGRPVLMDFGTGRELDDSANVQIAGTPLYLAPEVLAGGTATPRSDVYSLGVVLFRLLTNSYPVSGRDLNELRSAHAAGGDPDAPLDRAGVPHRIRRVLARAINPDPARRYGSADALGVAIAAAQRKPGRRLVTTAAALAAIVAACALGWNLGLREQMRPALLALGLVTTPRIAVLPFRNAGSDPGHDLFFDGLTSEVIRNLAGIDGLEVRSQTSSFYFKDRPRDLRDVARRLNVDLVVEATVQRSGNRLRINAQLVRTADNVALWSEPFDRTLGDVFEIQDEISRAIVNKLRLTLGRGQRRYQTNTAAYDLYLRGRALLAQRGSAKGGEAVKVFEQVIALDETFAPAHAGLAEAWAVWSWQPVGPSYEQSVAAMRPAAQRALELDPMLAEAHAAMGVTFARELDWQSAKTSFEQALRLPPFQSHIHVSYASALYPTGEVDKAKELLTAALIRDPLSLDVRRELGIAQYVAGDYAEAVANLQQVVAEAPTYFAVQQMLARSLMQMGRPDDALALLNSKAEHRAWERWMMPAYLKTGRTADVERLISDNKDDIPHRRVIIYAALGDKERTLEALGPAIDMLPQRMAFMLACPEMAFLRGDPRLEPLLKRLNLR